MRTRWTLWNLSALLLLWVTVSAAQVTLPQPRKAWTVLVYQAADNDLESALIKDFNEMERVGSGQTLNIVVQLDRSPHHDTSNDNWTTTRRYYVTRDTEETFPPDFSTPPNGTIRSILITDLGKKNMGDEGVLRDFLLWGIQNFPADRYFVILSDHGAGVRPFRGIPLPTRGMMFADTFNDFLSEDETKRALEAAVQALGRPFDIVGLDASEMSILDIAYQFRSLCRYLIASQLSEPNDGYPYERFLWELHQNPNIGTEEFLRRFVQHYMDSYRQGQPTNGEGSSVTIAVYNQSVVPAYVQKVDALAQTLSRKVETWGGRFVSLRRQTQSFSELIYRDLYHYCLLLRQNVNDAEVRQAAQEVMNLHGPGSGKALLYEDHRTGYDINVDNAYGIAVYFPEPDQFDTRYLNANDFARETHWGEFLQALRADNFPPEVELLFPLSGQSVPIVRPTLLLKVTDEGSAGLDSNSVRSVRLNGELVSQFEFEPTTGRLKISLPRPLAEGQHTLVVTVADTAENTATHQFTFEVALPKVARGVRTFSVPLWLETSEQRQGWQSLPEKTARWVGAWAIFSRTGQGDSRASFAPPNSGVSLPPAGLGYFARFDQPVTLAADGVMLEPDRSYAVTVQNGWNLIANPYPVPILWNSVQVQVGTQTPISLTEAISRGFIWSPPIGYRPNPTEPFKFGSYFVLTGDQVWLQPFEAYWVRIDTQGTTVKLILPPPVGTTTSSRQVAPSRQLWAVRLQVLTGDRSVAAGSELLQLGVASDAQWGQDGYDVPLPPLPPDTPARAYFVTENWRKRSPEALAIDIRPNGERIVWDLVVETVEPMGQEWTLTWSDMTTVPSSVRLWLVDTATGQTVSLRQVAAYRFRMDTPQRRFRIVAQKGSSPLRLVGTKVISHRGTRGATIQGSVTAPAYLTVTIRSLTGRPVRVLTKEQFVPAGRWQVSWDGRSSDGALLPAGVYLCELVAKDETGMQVRTVVPVTLGR